MATKPPFLDDNTTTKGVADDAAEPLITSNLASLPTQVGARDEPVEIVDDGDKPGEEGSAVEGARAGLADVVPDDLGSIGLDDLASGEEDAQDDSGSLDGLDPPEREAPAFSDKPDIVDMSGGGGDQGADTTAEPPSGGDLSAEFVGRGARSEDYAPGDYGADPDQPPSGGNASVEQDSGAGAGARAIGKGFDDVPVVGKALGVVRDSTTDPGSAGGHRGSVLREALEEQDVTAGSAANPPNPGPHDVVSDVTSKDGSISVVKFGDGTTIVDDRNNHTTTTLLPDGSTTTVDRTTGGKTTTDPATQPPGDTEVVLTPAEQQELRDSIDALGQHRGDQGTETQPAEGDDGAFGASAPKSEIAITESQDRAIDMLGDPGSSDLDFGGGGGGGNNSGDPNFGTIDPGESADAGRQTDGAEQDPFDRQQATLEQTEDSSDDDGASGPLQPGDLRPVDDTEHLREVTLDIG